MKPSAPRPASLALLAALAVPAVACGGGSSRAPFSPLDSDGRHFRDAEGRAVILRGINARVEGVFDVTFSDGRIPLEPIPPLEAADCARMAELGFTVLRLPINWSGVEPERNVFNETYLLAVDAAVECAHGAGLFVLVDFHQDAYSKEIGEDGAPLWAIVPPPEMLLEGPLDDLEERRASAQVAAAFASFFAAGDPHGLQAEMIDAIEHVAARYADHPGVIGFELYNEPVIAPDLLDPFHFAAAERVRKAAPDKLVFFEPPATRNFTDFVPLASEPFPVTGGVYAPHVYTLAFSDPGNKLATVTLEDLRMSNENARVEAEAWGTPLFIGEFGAGPTTTNYQTYLTLQQQLQDEYFASSAAWLWKENSQGSWGLYDHDEMTETWTERPGMTRVLARPYAHRIAGTPTALAWDDAATTLTLSYERAVAAPSVVMVPDGWSVTGVSCDGAAVTPAPVPEGARLEVSCGASGAHTLVVTLSPPPIAAP